MKYTKHNKENCIYCGKEFDPCKGQGDHVIPAILGEFRGDKHFRRICTECNNRIGNMEQQIVQSGPESVYLQEVNPFSCRRRGREHRNLGGAMGAPPPESWALVNGRWVLVKQVIGRPIRDVEPVDNIAVTDMNDLTIVIQYHKGMRPENVRKKLKDAGFGEFKKAEFTVSDELHDSMCDLAMKLWPNMSIKNTHVLQPGRQNGVPGTKKFIVNSNYYQAIAKIGFHYFLLNSGRGFSGRERHFSKIRDYIINGGDRTPFFESPRKLPINLPVQKMPDGSVLSPVKWSHILAGSDWGGNALVMVLLFAGPGCYRPAHFIWLGDWESKIITRDCKWCDAYTYDKSIGGKYAGEVCRMSWS